MKIIQVRVFLFVALIATMASGCKKEVVQNHIYDNVIYQLDTVPIYTSALEKTKVKTSEQYLTILYADLFNQAISTNQLADMAQLILAVGDKLMIRELIVSSFMNNASVQVPTDAAMRSNVDDFITDTYIKFYVRLPTEYERYFLKSSIENDANLSPQLIYTSFALSTEYQYY